MKVPEAPEVGCRLCGASWGEYRTSIYGKEEVFCCDACARFYGLAIHEAEKVFRWEKVDRLFLYDVHGVEAEGWVRHGTVTKLIHVEGTQDGSRLLSFTVKDLQGGSI
jgi:hypothetical protein